MRAYYGLLIVLGIILCGTTVFCGEEAIDLDKIVVTPARVAQAQSDTPYTVDAVSPRELEQSSPVSLGDALEDTAGVNILSSGAMGANANVRMRGANAAGVLILRDGIPLNSPRDGEVDLSTIPLSSIDRIEVVHGPGSGLYGSSTIGGIVNILSKDPPQQPETEITSLAGTHNTFIQRLTTGATAGKFGYIVNGEHTRSDGFRQNADVEANSASAKLTYALNDANDLGLNTGFFKSRLGAPGKKTAADTDDRQTDYKSFVDATWGLDAGDGLELKTRVYRNYERLRFFENSAGPTWGDIAGDTFRHTTVSNGFDTQATKEFCERYSATGGFTYVGNFNNSTSSGKHAFTTRAGYLQNIFELTEKIKFDLGARLDDYSNFGTQVNPNAGLVYSFNQTDRVRASVSKAFRAPTFNDLYWPDDGYTAGNPDVKPEKAMNVEAGIDKQLLDNLTASLTCFHSRFSDMIIWAENSTGKWVPSNVDSAEINGAELSTNLRISQEIGLECGYTYQRPQNRSTKKDLIYQPRQKFNTGIKYAAAGLTCRLNALYTGMRYTSTDNTEKLKQYYTLNFSLDKKITRDIDALLYANNILNRKYEANKDYPAPGFSLLAGVRIGF